MENISKLLRMAFYIVVFFLAVTALYMMSHQYNELVVASMANVSDSLMVYEPRPVDTTNYVTRSELIAMLMDSLQYDIEVINQDGRFIIAAVGYSPDTIGSYPLTGSNYTKSYLYNMDGTISRIVYHYIS